MQNKLEKRTKIGSCIRVNLHCLILKLLVQNLVNSFYVSKGLIVVAVLFYFLLSYYTAMFVFIFYWDQLRKAKMCDSFYFCYFNILNIGNKADDWWMIDIDVENAENQ